MTIGAITWYLKDAVPSGATLHRSLSESSAGISAATTGTGWTVGTSAAGFYSLQNGGSKRIASTFGVTAQPASVPSQTVGDCWRTENAYTGTFGSTSWTLTCGFRSVTAAASGVPVLKFRVWRTTDANGASPTELTSGITNILSFPGSVGTGADTVTTLTWTPGSALRLNGEYLFFQFALYLASQSASTSADVLFRTDTTAYTIAAPMFTPAGSNVTRGSLKKDIPISIVMAGSGQKPVTTQGSIKKDIPLSWFMAGPGQALAPNSGAVSSGSYVAPYTCGDQADATFVLPCNMTPVVDTLGTLSGRVTVGGVGQPYARVACYHRVSGNLVNITNCDLNGYYSFAGLDRTLTSDRSYFVVFIDPNGLGTQYDSGILDREIPS